MGKKKSNDIKSPLSKKAQKRTLRKSMLAEENRLAILRAPINSQNISKKNSTRRIEVVNGVVCTIGRYSRLYEDYDDK